MHTLLHSGMDEQGIGQHNSALEQVASSPCGCPAISHCCFRTSPCPWAVVPPSLSPQVQLSLGLLLLGVGIATVTDLQLNALGSIISLLAIISTGVAQIVSRG